MNYTIHIDTAEADNKWIAYCGKFNTDLYYYNQNPMRDSIITLANYVTGQSASAACSRFASTANATYCVDCVRELDPLELLDELVL